MSNREPSREDSRYPRVVAFVRDTPWQILESKLLEITNLVTLRASGQQLTDEEIEQRLGGRQSRRDQSQSGNVAVIPIYGVITPKADVMSEMSGGTSIDRFQASLQAAVDDPNVSSIVLDVDSPGGSVSMLQEAAAQIRQARAKKPVVAVANGLAASAAYRLASQASEFVSTPSGSVGSVGTLAAHDDISKLQEMTGVKTTLVTAGKHKAELSPFAPLSEDARQHLQEVVDKHQQAFEQDVARGRRVPIDTVRSDFGQGRVLLAQDALKVGMIDRIDTLDNVIAGLQENGTKSHGARQITVEFTGSGEQLIKAVQFRGVETDDPWQALGYVEVVSGPIAAHSTATTDKPWDGPANKARLANDDEKSWIAAFAWYDDEAPDPNGDGYPDRKGDFKFIHHEVDEKGGVHAANVNACSMGIAVLNGGRTGTTIPDADRQGVWEHLARHLRDAGQEPPPLKSLEQVETGAAASGLSFADKIDDLVAESWIVVDDIKSLAGFREQRHLSGAKRERLAGFREAIRAIDDAVTDVLSITNPDNQRDETTSTVDDAVGAYLSRLSMEAISR